MTYYTGSVPARNLFSTILGHITAVQPGETTSWWKKESSLDADGAYTSVGSSGTERIVLVFREANVGREFTAGFARDYTPGAVNTAGAFDNITTSQVKYFTATQNQDIVITYDVNVTKDRVIIHVQGDKLISGWQNTVVYLGMPIRYDSTDKRCVVFAQSENAAAAYNSKLNFLQDSVNAMFKAYDWKYVDSPGNPSWGNNYFLETLHFGIVGEGLRGELEGLYGTNPTGMVDGDDIDVLGERYKVVIVQNYIYNAFPRTALLIKKS